MIIYFCLAVSRERESVLCYYTRVCYMPPAFWAETAVFCAGGVNIIIVLRSKNMSTLILIRALSGGTGSTQTAPFDGAIDDLILQYNSIMIYKKLAECIYIILYI